MVSNNPDEQSTYDTLCGICFTPVDPVENPRGEINSCSHLFCSHCITEWATNTNVCPSCKARFTRIVTRRPGRDDEVKKVRKKNYRGWEAIYEEEEDEESERAMGISQTEHIHCDICKDSHNAVRMIMCDRRECMSAFHLECLHLEERPVVFFCPACRKKDEPVVSLASHEEMGDTTSQNSVSSPPNSPAPPLSPSPKVPMKLDLEKLRRENVTSRDIKRASTVASSRRVEEVIDASDQVEEENPYYFLVGNSHSQRAQREFQQLQKNRKELRENENLRRARLSRINMERNQKRIEYTDLLSKKHPRDALSANNTEDIDAILNPEKRKRLEESLVKQFAKDLYPVVHQKHNINQSKLKFNANGGIKVSPVPTAAAMEQQHNEIWNEAISKARIEVKYKLDQMIYQARQRKEKILKAQAQRESAALAKLAQLIASRSHS